jgi:Ca2+/H+ antiporter
MAVMGLLFPAVLHFTHSEVQYGKSEVTLSRFSSCIMLLAYASYLFFQLKSHRSLYNPIDSVTIYLKGQLNSKIRIRKEYVIVNILSIIPFICYEDKLHAKALKFCDR